MPPKNDIVKWLWRLFFLFIAVNVVAFLLMSSGLIGYLPRIDELENPIDKYASQVISSDDQLFVSPSIVSGRVVATVTCSIVSVVVFGTFCPV